MRPIVLAALLSILGCSTLDPNELTNVVPGMDKSEVLTLLGPPETRRVVGVECFTYSFSDSAHLDEKERRRRTLYVQLQNDKVTKQGEFTNEDKTCQ